MSFKCVTLSVEYLPSPIGMDEKHPRFSWEIESEENSFFQTAYELEVSDGTTSGIVESPATNQVELAALQLKPRTEYSYKVRIRDNHGQWSDWSAPGHFETGRMTTDAGSPFLTPPHGAEPMESARYLRREITIGKPLKRARLYASSFGMYTAFVNGQAVSDHLFAPGWTDYHHRLQYQTYDVTLLLQPGTNALGAVLNEGWYAGRIVRHYSNGAPTYGEKPAFWCELFLEFQDGSTQTISTDANWKYSSDGPIRMADIYMGIDYDATMELDGWAEPDFDDSAWQNVPLEERKIRMEWNAAPPVKRMHTLSPKLLHCHPGTRLIYDLGQNCAGFEHFGLTGVRRGQKIMIRHAEMLDGSELYTENLRTARATTVYIAKGEPHEVFEPQFTWYGFRYLEITGLDEVGQLEFLEVHSIYSESAETGFFECSDPLVNQLFSNAVWGQRSNYIDIPSDCPQRDERYGWSGDAQIFFPTASFNQFIAPFFTKWLEDFMLCRNAKGAFPHYAPYYMEKDPAEIQWDTIIGAPGWADAGIIIPWELYRRYGDRRILQRHYQAMCDWVDLEARESKGFLRDSRLYGDWLSLNADLPSEFVASCYFAHGTELLANIAGVLGFAEDEKRYRELFENIKLAVFNKYVPFGYVLYRTQSAFAMLLQFNLIDGDLRYHVSGQLQEDIELYRGGHISSGFLGAPLLCAALSENGRAAAAYRLLRQTTYPSWLYPITQGATTIWERLNSYSREQGFGDAGMNSFNHYAYGAVAAFLYENVGGLQADTKNPGYQEFTITPLPGGGLEYAKISYRSIRGLIRSEWYFKDDEVLFEIEVPPNTRCRFILPDDTATQQTYTSGIHRFSMQRSFLRKDLCS